MAVLVLTCASWVFGQQTEPPAKEKPETPPAPAAEESAPKGNATIQLETPKAEPLPELPPLPGTPAPRDKPRAEGPPQSVEPAQDLIEDIIFRGNRRIPASTLRARVFSHKGSIYDEGALERDFMALWNTGFLDDIRLEVVDGEKGKVITFYVREKKLVRSIDYKGLSSVQQSDVLDEFKKKKVGLSIQSQFDPVVVKRAQVVLEDMLASHGRQFARVRGRTRNIPPNSVALTFIVSEGPKVKIGDIRFEGNTLFSDKKLVRAMKYSRPSGAPPWFYWLHKTYDKDKILADLELHIRTMYQDNGYFYVVIKEPQTKMVDTQRRWPFFFFAWGRGKRVDVTIPIEEGDRYRLGRFLIRGNKLFKQEQLAPVLQLKTGDIFNLGKVRKSIENFQKLYGAYGYINFTADPDIEPDVKKKVINLALDFEEEKQYFVHRIEFDGNTKTRDKVVRRELLVDEGNIFSSELWDLSVLRINQLGFFEEVKKEDYDIRQNRKDSTVDVIVKVKEKGRNSIGFSGGVSGISGSFIGFNYATNNFLGLGETLSMQFQWGTYQRLYQFGFTEPYLFDRPITTGFTIFKSDYRYDQLRQAAYYSGLAPNTLASLTGGSAFQNYSQNSSGFTVFASYPLRRSFARVGVTYSYSISSLEAFSDVSNLYFQALSFRGIEGPNILTGITQSTIQPNYTYNTTNHPYEPTSGKYLGASIGFSGSILGGNVNSIRPILEGRYYRPVAKKKADHPHVLAIRGIASMVTGYGGKVPPPFSRFYIGGEEDLRGYYIRSVSPIAWYPTVAQVCNKDPMGQDIPALGSDGQSLNTCGSYTRYPVSTVIYPGGDVMAVANVEYRIPIAGPVTVAYFVDVGTNFVWRASQLKTQKAALASFSAQFPGYPIPERLDPIPETNRRVRATTGIEFQVVLPMVNMPVRIFYGYNVLRVNDSLVPPDILPDPSLFPNQATYEAAIRQGFRPLPIADKKSRVGFTMSRTF